MRHAHDGDWDCGTPYSGNGPCPGEDPGRRLFYICLPEQQADRDGNTYPESRKRASLDLGQLRLPRGCSPHHDPEVCDARSVVPAGTGIEVYATTLHYAPCHVNKSGFQCVVVLPRGTNTEIDFPMPKDGEDGLMTAKNKWLIAHEDAKIEGAFNGLKGENITLD